MIKMVMGCFTQSLINGSLAVIDYQSFVRVPEEGTQGEWSVMPAFKYNPNINDNFDTLYWYLMARGDGQPPIGRPAK